jgi:hypothetical protein
MYIYQAISQDKRWTPPKETIVKERPTEAELIAWLQANGGGIYRNILHKFDCIIKGEL